MAIDGSYFVLKPLNRSKYDLTPEQVALKSMSVGGKPVDAKVTFKVV